MPRLRPALAVVLFVVSVGWAADPIHQALAVQTALAEARDLLTANKPAEAVAILEQHLSQAAGNRAYLELLRAAYAAEVKKAQLTHGDPRRIAELKIKLALLGVSPAAAGGSEGEPASAASAVSAGPALESGAVSPFAPPPAPGSAPPATRSATPVVDKGLLVLQEAVDLFHQSRTEPKKLGMASRLFAAAFADQIELTPDQQAAWAYCRIRVAADRLGRPDVTGSVAAALADEIEEALTLAPTHTGLQRVGRELISAARLKAEQDPTASGPAERAADSWEVVEGPSFRVRHHGANHLAEEIATVAEAKRADLFARWSGPPGGDWGPKCDIYLHADAAALHEATQQPLGATGHATVHLKAGQPVLRRMDLRADDPTVIEVSLPRELTHIILADLFPVQAPPRWAVEGMAVLAATPAEVDRYLRTAARCRREGEMVPVETLLSLSDPPADRVTGFYVGSVMLVEFLVRTKGEKAFLTFLRDSQRYGLASALRRQYGVADPRQLDEWLSRASSLARGQSP
jgi:hypothetical protein